jgi:NADH-quinone oxidoreductase subunit A
MKLRANSWRPSRKTEAPWDSPLRVDLPPFLKKPAPLIRSGFFFYPKPVGPPINGLGMPAQFLPVFIQILVAIGFAAVSLTLSVVLGKSAKRSKMKDTAYECGMLPEGDGAPRFSVKFYIVAMLFVIFDIEVVFMYPWAVQFRDLIVGGNVVPLVSMAGFAAVLAVAYVYALRKGALSWKN